MKFFIVFAASLACACAIANEYQADSPDVAAAKLAHFVEKAKAAAAVGAEPDYITSYYINYYKSLGLINEPSPVTVLPNGYLADTPEVSAAKAAFNALYQRELQQKSVIAANTPVIVAYNTNDNSNYYKGVNYAVPLAYKNYYNPATITVLPNGFLADTPEVAAAKAVFNANYNRALIQQA